MSIGSDPSSTGSGGGGPELPTHEALRIALDLGLASTRAPLARGDTFHRYVILDRLGAGGMGEVYAAYDPELDRKVALKLLHAHTAPSGAGVTRLWREAQAMAQLSHPNVITVYDVAHSGSEVFIAMEFVDGGTLRRWARAVRRPWREVLRVYLLAARGLAAAHRAGLVHRDFKPDNVLLGADGRVRVADFGLARVLPDAAPSSEEPASSPRLLETPLTQAGATPGTPSYMSPEQHLGHPADARSDQFGFCVALYEALYGELPFAVGDRAAVLRGEVRLPPRDAHIPSWVRRALLRGLRLDPDLRYPSMDALVTALSRDPAALRWRLAAVVLLFAAGAGAAALALRADEEGARACRAGPERLAGVWDESRKESVLAAFRATGTPYAEAAAREAARLLDRYAGDWAGAYWAACEVTRRGEQSETMLDLRMGCLRRRRGELRALGDVFAKADTTVVLRAVDAANALEPVAYCADLGALTRKVRPPGDPSARAALEGAGAGVARAKALHDAGKYREALRAADDASAVAARFGYRPLEAAAALWRGLAQERTGELAGAEASLRAASRAGEAGEHDRATARARIALVSLTGMKRGRLADGYEWGREAAATLERIGRERALEGALENAVANLLYRQGRYDEAEVHYRRALALRTRALGPDHPEVGHTQSNLGILLRVTGKRDAALPHLERAVEIARQAFGPAHPDTAVSYNNLAPLFFARGDLRGSLELFEKALRIQERALGPEHPDTAAALNNVALVEEALGRFAEARRTHERALAIRRRMLGGGHADVAVSLSNLALVLSALGRHDEAAGRLEEALAIYERTAGNHHPLAAATLVNLGEERLAQARPAEALACFERALRIEKGAETLRAATARLGIGEALLATGGRESARGQLVQALAVLEKKEAEPAELARARFALARAEGPGARKLAEQARDGYAKAGNRYRREKEKVEAWLRGRRAGRVIR